MLDVALHNSRQHRQFQHTAGPLVLARLGTDRPVWMPVDGCRAQAAEALVEIVPANDGIALAMAGCEAECFCGRTCSLTGSCQLPIPAMFAIGDTRFEVCDTNSSLARPARPLERLFVDAGNLLQAETSIAGPAASTVSRWFATIGALHRWATSLQELYAQAARSTVDSIGLDGAVVLRRRDGGWEIAASHLPHPEFGIHCDLRILDELLRAPETLFHGNQGTDNQAADHDSRGTELRVSDRGLRILWNPKSGRPQSTSDDAPPSRSELPSVVVSPLRNAAKELTGAIYGYRSVRTGNARRGIRYLEAHMIELLAGAVSEGISRLEHEADVDRRRALLERAFAGTLNNESRKINSEKREVTLLFADLRHSTSLSADFEIDQLCELISQVLDCLSAAVMDHDGLVVDYYGDGLAAMWNAPADQADHAELACRAAVRMLEALPDVSSDWADLLPNELRLAIGVHTGIVQVGNAGSTRRTKYGPRGPDVHIASRIEAAAKELNVPLVVTQPVADRLSSRFATHRVCRARVRGVQLPVELFSVCPATIDAPAAAAWKNYDAALAMFECGKLPEAAELLRELHTSVDAVPARFLAEHIQKELDRQRDRRSTDKQGKGESGVITLGTK